MHTLKGKEEGITVSLFSERSKKGCGGGVITTGIG